MSLSPVKYVVNKLASLLRKSDNSKSVPVNTAALAPVLSDTKGLVTILPTPTKAERFSWDGPDKIIDMNKVINAPDDGIDRIAILNWLEALESGKINQTRGMLVNGNGQGFCCLGVMCKLDGHKVSRAEPGGTYNGPNGDESVDIINAFYVGDKEYTGTPPSDVTKKYGFGDVWDNTKVLDIHTYVNMNDNGKTFKEIAAALRADYKSKGIL